MSQQQSLSQSQSQSRFKTSFEFEDTTDPATHTGTASNTYQKSARPIPPRLPDPPASTDTLWIDEFAPKTSDQLVIHSGKVKQVREWLTTTFKSKPFLAVTGPPGTGKLSTVLAIAADLNLRVLEWVNPLFAGTSAIVQMDDDGQSISTAPSIIQSFLDFLSRGTRYSQPSDLLLFRDFPIFSKSGLDRTHAVLTSLLRTRSRIPRIVFIFTDFNIPDSDFGHSGSRASSNLECPIHHGDLRAAINTLQFAHLSRTTASSTLECTSDRSRSLFRAVGRCMYAQRVPPPSGHTPVPLPPHLAARWSRAHPLEVDPSAILTNLAVSSDLFAMYLHANYPEYIRPLAAHVFVADAFVDADMLQRAGRRATPRIWGLGEDELDRDLREM
ncbi:Rad17 cell cycle checkpoint protein-domain-containing protein, partial [Catenaria anguillulae PL171]